MKRFATGCSALTLAMLLIAGCSRTSPLSPDTARQNGVQGVGAAGLTFIAHLTGAEEAPPNDSPAQGQAIFKLEPSGSALSYRLIASNIENVFAAHIHLGEPGVNGPIVVTLFGPVAPGGGRTDGVLATGTITAADFENDLEGQPFSALIAAIEAGGTYVNVHTNDGIDPPGTGPGDIPTGEIRGQIR